MFNTLIDYFKNEEYSISLTENKIYIFNYKRINSVSNKEINISIKNKILKLYGKNLVITNLETKELLISGVLYKVEVKDV